MATWYGGMTGKSGHKYHQDYALPVVLDLLNIKKEEKILDVGCGQGVLYPHVKKSGGVYYGIDISEKMIQMAKKKFPNNNRFYAESADSINNINELKTTIFDSVVFMLSIQDMDPLDKIISTVAKKLKSSGRLIIFMLHPAFRIPRQSGWGEDKKRKLIYRRVDRYLTENTVPLNTKIKHKGKSVTSYFYHRPLQKYFSEFEKNNLLVSTLLEIPEKKRGYEEFPTFLAIRAIKTSSE